MVLGVLGGPIYWDLEEKSPKNPYTSSAFFGVFFGNFEPLYTGKTGNFGEIGSKITIFGYFSGFLLGAKFNRFFIILGGGVAMPTGKG